MEHIICIAGKNNIASDFLKFVSTIYNVENLCVVINRDDSGKHTWQKSLKQTADLLNVRIVSLKDLYHIPNLIFFSVEFDRIIDPNRFLTKKLYNIHFSLLPKYKGVYTAIWPVLNGDEVTGVTLHEIDSGIDTGDIIDQFEFRIQTSESSRDIYQKCLDCGLQLLKENFVRLVEGKYLKYSQNSLQSSYFSLKSIDFANLNANLNQTAFQIHKFIKAFSFKEYQLPIINNNYIKDSEITSKKSTNKPGIAEYEDENVLILNTVDYNIKLFKDYTYQLFNALEMEDVYKVEMLIKRIPDLNYYNKNGWSPLIIAAYKGNFEITRLLVEAGADINDSNLTGTTILMYAKTSVLKTNNLDILYYLVENGADVNSKDIYGLNCIDYALKEGNTKVIEFFKSRIWKSICKIISYL